MNNKNLSSGKGLTLVKTTLLPGQDSDSDSDSLLTSHQHAYNTHIITYIKSLTQI